MEELWVRVEGTNYEMSNKGRMRRLDTGRLVNPSKDVRKKYPSYQYSIQINGKSVAKKVEVWFGETWFDSLTVSPQWVDAIKRKNDKENELVIFRSGVRRWVPLKKEPNVEDPFAPGHIPHGFSNRVPNCCGY